MVEGDSQSLRVFSGLPGTPYNKTRVPKNEMPKTLKDFLKPFWKGKIASTPYVTGLNLLAAKELWGREAALDYVKQFSKQVAGLIRCNEMDRVVTGEFLALVMDCNGARTFELQAQGAPLEHVIPADGAMIRHFYLNIPKNAEHPNAAKLFTTFLLTKEAQKLLWESDFSDLYMFPESQLGQKVRRARKARREIFRADPGVGRQQSRNRKNLRRDGQNRHPEVTPRSAVIPSEKRGIFLGQFTERCLPQSCPCTGEIEFV